jgi:hypothetical protein
LIEIDVVNERRFAANTDESVWHLNDDLTRLEGRAGVGDMASRSKATRITLSPYSVLCDLPLRKFSAQSIYCDTTGSTHT